MSLERKRRRSTNMLLLRRPLLSLVTWTTGSVFDAMSASSIMFLFVVVVFSFFLTGALED